MLRETACPARDGIGLRGKYKIQIGICLRAIKDWFIFSFRPSGYR